MGAKPPSTSQPTQHGVGTFALTPQPFDARVNDTHFTLSNPNLDSDIELAAGTRIQQYELIRELGRGGMGQVWAARDTRLGRRVAIKCVVNASEEVAEAFLIEARATAQCNHDNIVIIHEVDEHDGVPYMVLELLDGQTLREIANATGPMPASRVVELMLPVAHALGRAHELALVHRDLKLIHANVDVRSLERVRPLVCRANEVGRCGDGTDDDCNGKIDGLDPACM